MLRARTAVERADVCLIMIDAAEGITEQDEKIAGIAHEAGKASVVVVNKWDLIEKDNNTVKEFNEKIGIALSYMTYAPILYVSARTGQRVSNIFENIMLVHSQANLRVSTGMLNDVLAEARLRTQPPTLTVLPSKRFVSSNNERTGVSCSIMVNFLFLRPEGRYISS